MRAIVRSEAEVDALADSLKPMLKFSKFVQVDVWVQERRDGDC